MSVDVVLKCLWTLCCSVCGRCVAVSVDVVLQCLWMLCCSVCGRCVEVSMDVVLADVPPQTHRLKLCSSNVSSWLLV